MKIGMKVRILPSHELDKIGLMSLEGTPATVLQVCRNKEGKVIGAWVKIPGLFQGEKEWFIPEVSLSII